MTERQECSEKTTEQREKHVSKTPELSTTFPSKRAESSIIWTVIGITICEREEHRENDPDEKMVRFPRDGRIQQQREEHWEKHHKGSEKRWKQFERSIFVIFDVEKQLSLRDVNNEDVSNLTVRTEGPKKCEPIWTTLLGTTNSESPDAEINVVFVESEYTKIIQISNKMCGFIDIYELWIIIIYYQLLEIIIM